MDGGSAFASALDWWVEAGVDVLVDDDPRDWLVPKASAAAAPVAAAAAPAVAPDPEAEAPRTGLPATLIELQARLIDPTQLTALGPARAGPVGDPAAGLMILVDMPEPGDAEGGGLLSGEAGRLLDRMLAAIRLSRANVYLASIAPARILGRPDPALIAELSDLARLHIALAQPRMLLLMGDRPVHLITGKANVPAVRGGLHQFNHHGATVAAIATYHPRFLLQHAPCKADAWADLRLLDQEFRR